MLRRTIRHPLNHDVLCTLHPFVKRRKSICRVFQNIRIFTRYTLHEWLTVLCETKPNETDANETKRNRCETMWPAIRKKIPNIVILPNCRNGSENRNGSEGRNASKFRNGYEFQLPEGDWAGIRSESLLKTKRDFKRSSTLMIVIIFC